MDFGSGFFGDFGGAYVPEMLVNNIEELAQKAVSILAESSFQLEFQRLLKDYVGRPSPLYRADKLSKHYGCEIFLKREDLNHTGSHKITNAIGQVLLAKQLGKSRIIAETGAGQHGVATATACALLELPCVVYMGAVDVERQSPNVARMTMLGAKVVSVDSGSQTLKDATNEAIRDWMSNPENTHYVIGSAIGPHPYPSLVAHFQSVIGKEIKEQLAKISHPLPTHVIACVGGGSNAIGTFRAFLNEPSVKIIGVEAAGSGLNTSKTAATLTLGKTGVLHGCKTYLLQDDDGQIQEAHSISAGLDYPGVGPEHSYLKDSQRVEYVSVTDEEAVQAAFLLTRIEGIIPALESAHAFAYLEKMSLTGSESLVICLSGRGDKDLACYQKHFKMPPNSN